MSSLLIEREEDLPGSSSQGSYSLAPPLEDRSSSQSYGRTDNTSQVSRDLGESKPTSKRRSSIAKLSLMRLGN